MRRVLSTKLGVIGTVFVLALVGVPTLLGVGRTSAKETQATPNGTVAAGAPVRMDARAKHGIPFTKFDVFLLLAGGTVLLVVGANADRRRKSNLAATPSATPSKAEA